MDPTEGLDDFLKHLKVKQTQIPIQNLNQMSKGELKRMAKTTSANLAQQKQITAINKEVNKQNETALVVKELSSLKVSNKKNEIQTDLPISKSNSQPENFAKNELGKDHNNEETKLFKNKAFVFIPFGIVFTKKQIEILSENIRKKGGKTFEFSFFDWKPLSFVDLLIVTSNQMPYKTVAPEFHERLDAFTFIDSEWIAKCLQQNLLIDILPFKISWMKVIEPEAEIKVKTRDIYATRHLYRGANNNNNNKRLKRNVKDTEALDQYLEEERLELEALELESDLMDYPIKKIKDNNQIFDSCKYLFDYTFENQVELIVKAEDQPDSPKTQIISSDDDCKYEINSSSRDFSKTKQEMEMDENDDSIEMIEVLGVKKRFSSSDIEIFHDFEVKQLPKEIKEEYPLNQFVLDSDDDEIEIIQGVEDNSKNDGSVLQGLAVKGEQERVKLFKTFNPMNKQKAKYWDSKKEHFVCQTGAQKNYNAHITSELEKLQKVYTNEKDLGRMHAYRKALAIIRSVPFKIESPEDLKNITGIGQKIREKIEEIVKTGKLKKAEILTNDEKQKTIETLTQVWGIGVQTAIDLYHKGIKTIYELRKHQDLLNDNQKIGLKYFDELQKRMPREEVAEIVKIVTSKIEELSEEKYVYEVMCCGSYRRGKATCGDIDILITRRDGKSFAGFLQKLIKSLEGTLLTDHLMWPKPGTHGNETYMGICKNGGMHRRIDIKIYPREQFGYAVLYFTGNDYFNRSMRLFARRKGLTLSDHGLYPSIRNKQEKVWTGQNIPCFTEEEVFKVLGLQYRPPTEREV